MDITQSILAVRKEQDGGHAQVGVVNEDINQITWHDGNPTNITDQQILDKQVELRAEHDALAWKRNRQAEYPDAIECVHALLDGGDTLTDLQAQRTAVKEKYSKG
jgi:hypothetical protein